MKRLLGRIVRRPMPAEERSNSLVVIDAINPAPPDRVLVDSPRAQERTVEIRGRNVPLSNHGLQFERLDTGERSIIFDIEVDWESCTRIRLDMGRIVDLLWPEEQRTLRVRTRLFDTENARYRPISDWSPPFLLARQGHRFAESEESMRPEQSASDAPAGSPAPQTWPGLLAALEAHGFYHYAEPAWIERAKALTLETGLLSSRTFDDLIGRVFAADAEFLAEGGVAAFLERITPFLERQGIQLQVSQEWSTDRVDYPVTVTGTTYLIYSQHDLGRAGYWTAALIRTLALVNRLLEEAGSPERLYGLQEGFGGEGSRAIALTPALHRLISDSPLIADDDRLLSVEAMEPWLE